MNIIERDLETLERNGAYGEVLRQRKARGDTAKPYGGRLENWSHTTFVGLDFFTGDLYDDPNNRWADGHFINTSNVIGYNDGCIRIETQNTIYDLGERLNA